MITEHRKQPPAGDLEIIVDIDLAIFGASPDVYAVYASNVRREYSWVALDDYRAGRSRVLQGFLERGHIYNAACFRAEYEMLARENIQLELSQLRNKKAF